MSKSHKQLCSDLKYVEHLLILASAVTGCMSVYSFCFVLGIVGSAIGLRIYVVTEGC